MNLVDRFVCRREGHKPALVISDTTTIKFSSYITTCLRCRKVYEATPRTTADPT